MLLSLYTSNILGDGEEYKFTQEKDGKLFNLIVSSSAWKNPVFCSLEFLIGSIIPEQVCYFKKPFIFHSPIDRDERSSIIIEFIYDYHKYKLDVRFGGGAILRESLSVDDIEIYSRLGNSVTIKSNEEYYQDLQRCTSCLCEDELFIYCAIKNRCESVKPVFGWFDNIGVYGPYPYSRFEPGKDDPDFAIERISTAERLIKYIQSDAKCGDKDKIYIVHDLDIGFVEGLSNLFYNFFAEYNDDIPQIIFFVPNRDSIKNESIDFSENWEFNKERKEFYQLGYPELKRITLDENETKL